MSLTLILWPALSALASCSPNDPGACAGLEPVHITAATAEHLAANDPQALAGLIEAHEYGQAMGCWGYPVLPNSP